MHLLELFATMFANNQRRILKNDQVLQSDVMNFSQGRIINSLKLRFHIFYQESQTRPQSKKSYI